jgi:hypothetical protein
MDLTYTNTPSEGDLGCTTMAELATLWKEQYSNEIIQTKYARYGGMVWFNNSAVTSWQRVGNSYNFRFMDRINMDDVEVLEYVTVTVDPETGCVTQEVGACPTKIHTKSTWRNEQLFMTHRFQTGVCYCRTEEVFSSLELDIQLREQLKAAKEAYSYALWLALIDTAIAAPQTTLIPSWAAIFPDHYWVSVLSLYDSMIRIVEYLTDVYGTGIKDFVAFVPSTAETCMISPGSEFLDCCVNQRDLAWFSQVNIEPQDMSLIWSNFFGLAMVKAPVAVNMPTDPFNPAPGTVRIVIAARDAFVHHMEVAVNNKYSECCDDYTENVNSLFVAGAKLLRPDRVFVLEIDCS